MALTRPKIWGIDTSIQQFTDPLVVLHQGATQANIDVGFLFNRANGLVSNVALYWNESSQSFITAYTTSSGVTDTNVAVTSYANVTVGNIRANAIYWANGSPFISSDYGNLTVAAYLPTDPTITTIQGRITGANIAWIANAATQQDLITTLQSQVYSNSNVAAYLPTYNGTIGGNVTVGGNLVVSGNFSVVGNITSVNYETVTNTEYVATLQATNVYAATIGNTGATLTGTLSTATQTGITSVGTLTGLTVSATNTSAGTVASITGLASPGNGGSATWNFQTEGSTINSYGSRIQFPNGTYQNTAYPGSYVSGTTALSLTTLNAATIGNVGAALVGSDLAITGNGSISGNLVVGNLNIASGNVTVSNSGSFIGNAITGYGALYAGIPIGYTTLPSTPLQIATNADTYSQLNMQNINNGSTASSDYVLTAGNGTDGTFYADFGLASNTYSYPGLSAIGPNDTYLLGVGYNTAGPYTGNVGNIVISSSNGMIKLATGGAESANVVATVLGTRLAVNASTTSTTTTTGALTVAGGVGIGGNLNVAGNIYSAGARTLTAADLEVVTYTANSITKSPSYGTYNSGSITSIQTLDDYPTGGYYSVNDTATSPGFIVYADFVGVTDFNRVLLNLNYTQNSGHTVDIDVYNNLTSAWDTLAVYSGTSGYYQFILSTIDSTPYLNAGVANVRVYHASFGNVSHETRIDYIALQKSVTGGQGPRGPTGATGSTGPTGPAWPGGYVANLTTFGSNLVANSGTTSTSTTTGALIVQGGVGITGNINSDGYGYFNGVFNETSSTGGVFVGNTGLGTPTPRIGFFNGTAAQNWQIDNYSGDFRWYTPGTTRVTLTASGSLAVNTAVTSTSTSTGALILAGGAGIAGNLFVGNNVTQTGYLVNNYSGTQIAMQITGAATKGGTGYHDFLSVTNTGGGTNPNKYFRLDSSGTLQVINSAYSSNIFNLTDGGDLTIPGKLTMSTGIFWAGNSQPYSSGSGGSGTPGGSSTQIQYNNSSSFAGASGLLYYSGNSVTLVSTATASTSTTSGAFQVLGGIGVSGNIWAGQVYSTNNGNGTNYAVGDDAWIGDINSANTIGIKGQQDPTQAYIVFGNSNTTNYIGRSGTNPITVTGAFSTTGSTTITSSSASSSTTTGALVVTGGAGIGGAMYAGSVFDNGNRVLTSLSSSGAGNLTVSVSAPASTTISLPATGPGAASVGSSTAIPVITTDAYGRVSATSTAAVVAPAGTLSGSTLASGVTASSLTSVGNLTTLSVAGVSTVWGNIVAASGTASTNTTTGALIVTGGAGVSGSLYVGSNIARNNRTVVTNFTGNTAPSTPLQGDEWFAANTGVMYKYLYDNISNTYNWINLSSAFFNANTGAVASTLALRDTGGNLTATNFLGVASSAKYADLAEIYASDKSYEPATVVVFGGNKEITITTKTHDTRVAGVISTNPAYLMNSEADGLPVAFTGRVPCKVRGPIAKGDVLVTSAYAGYAERIDDALYRPGSILGKALEAVNENEFATIEVVVGRF